MRGPIKALRHSLALRLLALSMLTLVLVLIIFSLTFGGGMKEKFTEVILPHVEQYQLLMLNELGNPPDRKKALQMANGAPMDIFIETDHEQWSTSGEVLDFSKIRHWSKHGSGNLRYANEHDAFYARSVISGSSGDYRVFLAYPRHNEPSGVPIVALAAVILIFMASYYAIRRLFSPLKKIQAGVARIGQGELETPILGIKPDELGELAGNINNMAGDIKGMLDAKRELLLAISHELRSPLTRAKVSAELVEGSSAVLAIRRDIREMEAMISGLLETERLNQRHQALDLHEVDIADLAKDVVAELNAEEKVVVKMPSRIPPLQLDAPRIRLLLKNVIENALRYNRAERGNVELNITSKDGLKLLIRDHGEGVSPEHLPHLLEPFYRADASRQRNTGGYGLGLYLSAAIAKAHGGELLISSEVGVGTEISISLPMVKQSGSDET